MRRRRNWQTVLCRMQDRWYAWSRLHSLELRGSKQLVCTCVPLWLRSLDLSFNYRYRYGIRSDTVSWRAYDYGIRSDTVSWRAYDLLHWKLIWNLPMTVSPLINILTFELQSYWNPECDTAWNYQSLPWKLSVLTGELQVIRFPGCKRMLTDRCNAGLGFAQMSHSSYFEWTESFALSLSSNQPTALRFAPVVPLVLVLAIVLYMNLDTNTWQGGPLLSWRWATEKC